MNSMIEEYRKCAELCNRTDYGNQSSVEEHNRAVLKMHEIVQAANQGGNDTIKTLATLLDEEAAKRWLAFQLLEIVKLSNDTKEKCLSIIRRIASEEDNVDALGARMWLEKREEKNKS